MDEGTWLEYGTPGTTVLYKEDIDLAIEWLEVVWTEAELLVVFLFEMPPDDDEGFEDMR